jgi:hypothetical protein
LLQFDEQDLKNESYICFRRREVKQTRKTRAQQLSFSDKMIRLRDEMAIAMDLAERIISRETNKKEVVRQSQVLWDKRAAFVDLKRKFPAFGSSEDDGLLVDKERPKRPRQTEAGYVVLRYSSVSINFFVVDVSLVYGYVHVTRQSLARLVLLMKSRLSHGSVTESL